MCDLVLGRTTIAFLSPNDLDFEVDYVLLLQKMAGSEVWVPQRALIWNQKCYRILLDLGKKKKKARSNIWDLSVRTSVLTTTSDLLTSLLQDAPTEEQTTKSTCYKNRSSGDPERPFLSGISAGTLLSEAQVFFGEVGAGAWLQPAELPR